MREILRSIGGGRGAHGKETPRKTLCGGPQGSIRAPSPRQLPTDHDYAVSTREYQSDQPSRSPLRPPPMLRIFESGACHDPAVGAGPAVEGGLLVGLDDGAENDEEIKQRKLT